MATLLTIPPEIRLQIYTLVLETPATLRLKSQLAKASDNYHRYFTVRENLTLPDFQQTTLLQTCRQVHDEASPIFYQANTFNFELSREPVGSDEDLEVIAGLDMMRNISLGIPEDWHKELNWRELSRDSGNNLVIGKHIVHALEQCPSARTLMIHNTYLPGWFYSFKRLLGDLATPTEKRKRLDQIKIVAVTEVSAMGELGASIGTGLECDIQRLSEWPQISLASLTRLRISEVVNMKNRRRVKNLGPGAELTGICVGTWRRKRSVGNSTRCDV